MRIALAVFAALTLSVVAQPARAQQAQIVTTCSEGVDGGTGTSTLTCPAVTVNFNPVILECEITTAGSHLAGSTVLYASVDGVHYGPIEDGGVTLDFNQDVNTVTTLSSPLLLGGGAGLSNSYLGVQPVTLITSNDGGTAGGAIVTCQVASLQSQSYRTKKPTAAPAAKK